jgi:hypothetical protein
LTAPFEVFEQSLSKASELKQQFDVERELRAEELDRHRKNWEERNAINSERSVVVNELKEVRSELALSKKRVDDLEGRNVACMDAEALLELRKVLENALRLVKITEDRRACLPYVPEILPLAVCPVTKQCMTNPVVAADGHTYERSAIEKHMEAAGENATSPLTGEKLASHDLVINWTMRKDIDDAVDKVLAQLARGE